MQSSFISPFFPSFFSFSLLQVNKTFSLVSCQWKSIPLSSLKTTRVNELSKKGWEGKRWETREAVSFLLAGPSVWPSVCCVCACTGVCRYVFLLCECVSLHSHTFLFTNQIPGPDRQRGPPHCLTRPRRRALTGANGEGSGVGLCLCGVCHSENKKGERGEERDKVVEEITIFN